MIIEAMKQALDALYDIEATGVPVGHIDLVIDTLRTAIEAAEKQEAWKTSDTAYRPDGLPQDFTVHEVENEGDWSEWVCPDPEQYFMKCCDCGLVHEMQFKVVKYSEGDECEDFDDLYVQAVFRARRTTPSAAQPAPVQEPVAYDKTELNCFAQDLYDQKMREGKRGHYESMFHVIHQCVKKVATSPAAQRQPLTDEQRRNIVRANKMRHDSDEIDPYGVIDDVEAAHGIGEKK